MRAPTIVASVAALLLAGCSSSASSTEPPPTTATTTVDAPAPEVSGGSSASCAAQDPEVVDGLVASAAGGVPVVLATVAEVDPAVELEVEGSSFGPIYTPLRLAEPRVLGGTTDATLAGTPLYAPGGAIGEVNQNGLALPAPGSRVLLELNTARTDEWAPDGPEVLTAYPVLDGRVVVTGGCLRVTADTPSGSRAQVSYEVVDAAGAVRTVRGEQGPVPLAVVESALAG